jgi:hypothetical protein
VKRVHVLSRGFETPNGRAFLFPLIVWKYALRDHGIDLRIFGQLSNALTDCDTLLVDSKFYRDRWATDTDAIIEEFTILARRCRVVYCDTADSSGWMQTELLPIVHLYAKAQLLKDRTMYMRPMYGHRPYTDFYHRNFGTEDSSPECSLAVRDPALLCKLRLSWNSGLADYSLLGPARAALYHHAPLPSLLRFPRCSSVPAKARSNAVSCRFGVSHPRETVAVQRRLIRERVKDFIATRKLSRWGYFSELRMSKVVISPFGFGEITLKDFEVFLTGGLLVKPDMSHMETWPDFFRANDTMLAHQWDLSDFDCVIERAVADYAELRHIAEQGQQRYLAHIDGAPAAEKFCNHLLSLLEVP